MLECLRVEVAVKQCSMCGRLGHQRDTCQREKGVKPCGTCAGLSHRVLFGKCEECGLEFAEEQVELAAWAITGRPIRGGVR